MCEVESHNSKTAKNEGVWHLKLEILFETSSCFQLSLHSPTEDTLEQSLIETDSVRQDTTWPRTTISTWVPKLESTTSRLSLLWKRYKLGANWGLLSLKRAPLEGTKKGRWNIDESKDAFEHRSCEQTMVLWTGRLCRRSGDENWIIPQLMVTFGF